MLKKNLLRNLVAIKTTSTITDNIDEENIFPEYHQWSYNKKSCLDLKSNDGKIKIKSFTLMIEISKKDYENILTGVMETRYGGVPRMLFII